MNPTSLKLLLEVVPKQTTPSLIITLSNVELLLHCTKPIIGFQWISGMSEHWGMTLQKFTTLITRRCSSN
jgi:hypothetical protein